LMRAASQMFEEPELSRLVPRNRGARSEERGANADNPLAKHEQIAYDWLAQGGKRSRPFITLAAYDALKGAPGTRAAEGLQLPDGVKRAALALEAAPKGSLCRHES